MHLLISQVLHVIELKVYSVSYTKYRTFGCILPVNNFRTADVNLGLYLNRRVLSLKPGLLEC